MKNKELQARVDAFIQVAGERKEKAADLDTLVGAIMKLPYGQLKKVLTDEVMVILEKYGYTE